MSPERIDGFIIEFKADLASHETRLITLEETVKDIKALTEATNELAINQKNTNEKIDELATTIKDIVDAPKKNWITVRTAILSSIGGAIGTGVIAWIITMLK